MVPLVSRVVVGLTFLFVLFKTSCYLICTEEYYYCFYKLRNKISFWFWGVVSIIVLEIGLCKDKIESFLQLECDIIRNLSGS